MGRGLILRHEISEKIPRFYHLPKDMWSYPVLAQVSLGYSGPKGRLSTCSSPVCRFTYHPKVEFSLDLHVLGTPPAFVLSQDQTLQEILEKQPIPCKHGLGHDPSKYNGITSIPFIVFDTNRIKSDLHQAPHICLSTDKQTTYYSVFKDQARASIRPPGKLALYKRGDVKGQDKNKISLLKTLKKMILLVFLIGIGIQGFWRLFSSPFRLTLEPFSKAT